MRNIRVDAALAMKVGSAGKSYILLETYQRCQMDHQLSTCEVQGKGHHFRFWDQLALYLKLWIWIRSTRGRGEIEVHVLGF